MATTLANRRYDDSSGRSARPQLRLGRSFVPQPGSGEASAIYSDVWPELLANVQNVRSVAHEATMNFLSAVVTIHLIKAQVGSGSPLARATKYTDPTTGWVYEPNQRGTFAIISSCALTIGLCVWSALHLNIPSSKQTVARSWVRNIVWVLMGLFGPELVVFGAWRQYVSARTLQNKIGALKGSPSVGLLFLLGR